MRLSGTDRVYEKRETDVARLEHHIKVALRKRRVHAGRIRITSGYPTEMHNPNFLGGTKTTLHRATASRNLQETPSVLSGFYCALTYC